MLDVPSFLMKSMVSNRVQAFETSTTDYTDDDEDDDDDSDVDDCEREREQMQSVCVFR